MTVVFADAGYWIALLHTSDRLHARARSVAAGLGSATIVTTHMVLVEVLNHFAGTGERRRSLAVQMVRDLEARPDVEIVPQTDAQFRAAAERSLPGPTSGGASRTARASPSWRSRTSSRRSPPIGTSSRRASPPCSDRPGLHRPVTGLEV